MKTVLETGKKTQQRVLPLTSESSGLTSDPSVLGSEGDLVSSPPSGLFFSPSPSFSFSISLSPSFSLTLSASPLLGLSVSIGSSPFFLLSCSAGGLFSSSSGMAITWRTRGGKVNFVTHLGKTNTFRIQRSYFYSCHSNTSCLYLVAGLCRLFAVLLGLALFLHLLLCILCCLVSLWGRVVNYKNKQIHSLCCFNVLCNLLWEIFIFLVTGFESYCNALKPECVLFDL